MNADQNFEETVASFTFNAVFGISYLVYLVSACLSSNEGLSK